MLLAKGGDDAAERPSADLLPPERALPTCLIAAAERVAAAQPGPELRHDAAATAALRALLEPWLAGAAAGEESSECPICYAHLAAPSQQVPSVACGTCRHRFHAWCLFRWFSSQYSAAEEALCPMCRCSQF